MVSADFFFVFASNFGSSSTEPLSDSSPEGVASSAIAAVFFEVDGDAARFFPELGEDLVDFGGEGIEADATTSSSESSTTTFLFFFAGSEDLSIPLPWCTERLPTFELTFRLCGFLCQFNVLTFVLGFIDWN